MDSYKETKFSRHSRTNVHVDSWRLWQQAEDLHRFKPDRVPDLEGEGTHSIPFAN